jgi:hypothetical protein
VEESFKNSGLDLYTMPEKRARRDWASAQQVRLPHRCQRQWRDPEQKMGGQCGKYRSFSVRAYYRQESKLRTAHKAKNKAPIETITDDKRLLDKDCEIDDLRTQRDHWRTQAEQITRLLTDGREQEERKNQVCGRGFWGNLSPEDGFGVLTTYVGKPR